MLSTCDTSVNWNRNASGVVCTHCSVSRIVSPLKVVIDLLILLCRYQTTGPGFQWHNVKQGMGQLYLYLCMWHFTFVIYKMYFIYQKKCKLSFSIAGLHDSVRHAPCQVAEQCRHTMALAFLCAQFTEVNLRSGYKKTYHALWKNLNRNKCIPIWNEFIPELFSTIFHNFYLEWISA